nr:hypothetical protein [Candidatus Sigynarchaeum springense]
MELVSDRTPVYWRDAGFHYAQFVVDRAIAAGGYNKESLELG